MFETTFSFLRALGLEENALPGVATSIIIVATLLGAMVLYWVLSRPIARFVAKRVSASETKLDDFLFPERTIHAIIIFAITLLLSYVVPGELYHFTKYIPIVHKLFRISNIVAGSWSIILLVRGFCDYLAVSDNKRGGSLVLRNLLTTIVSAIASLLIISIILGRDVAYVISGLGAMAAVLMLVFKDSILGMTAGIRLTVNKMLKVNDWVSVPKYGAEGRVEDLTLTAVKIRNWDQSISSVPPHALITDGFTNHEAMLEQGIRQIRRTFLIDVNSIRRMSALELKQFAGNEWTFGIDLDKPQVNLTLFRRWLLFAVTEHPRISKHPRFFVKEHPHSSTGVPIEVHFFVRCIDWAEFEQLQADFLDEILATVNDFSLKLYQAPAGTDFVNSTFTTKNMKLEDVALKQ